MTTKIVDWDKILFVGHIHKTPKTTARKIGTRLDSSGFTNVIAIKEEDSSYETVVLVNDLGYTAGQTHVVEQAQPEPEVVYMNMYSKSVGTSSSPHATEESALRGRLKHCLYTKRFIEDTTYICPK